MPSGPPCAGELLQSSLESSPEQQSLRLSPGLNAACRSDWLTLIHKMSFFSPHIVRVNLIRTAPGLVWYVPLLVRFFHKGPVWYQHSIAADGPFLCRIG